MPLATLLRLVRHRPAVAAVGLVVSVSACDGTASDLPPPLLVPDRPAFDGQTAWQLLDTQVAFGPRVPGRAGHAAQLQWMLDLLTGLADTVQTDAFTHVHTNSGQTLELTNVLARFRPEAERRLLFLAHWDTRPISDAAATLEERAMPVPGANDGASGTAVLLQVARHLAAARQTPPVGVDLLFVDGEDFGPTSDDMFLGSRRFAGRLDELDVRPVYGVLLDMVGDAEPRFPIEGWSAQYALDVAQRVWGVAGRLGYGTTFPMEVGQRVTDDHLPLNEAGLPTIDIIDFQYGPDNAYWHTPDDLPEQTSPLTLDMVGELVLELIYMGG